MTLTQEQLEWIVSEVVRRLKTAAAEQPAVVGNSDIVQLEERLITLETLRGRLDGVRRLAVASKAIITPAAVDRLKEMQIEVLRN